MNTDDFEKIYGDQLINFLRKGHQFTDPEVLKIEVMDYTVAHYAVKVNHQRINDRSVLLKEAEHRVLDYVIPLNMLQYPCCLNVIEVFNITAMYWTVAHEMAMVGYKFNDSDILRRCTKLTYNVNCETRPPEVSKTSNKTSGILIQYGLSLSVEKIMNHTHTNLGYVTPIN